MSYKHKYVPGTTYSFYNNSDDLEDNTNFNYWSFNLVHSDTFIPVIEDLVTLKKDIISGSDYRFYSDDFEFPVVEAGCYLFVIEDKAAGVVIYISDEIEVVDSADGLLFVSFRNDANIQNYNYTGLPSYRNVTHVELFNRKPARPGITEGYPVSSGSFKRVRTTLTKSFEFVTGWFDELEHDAMQVMIIHNDLLLALRGNFELMNKPDSEEYQLEWTENFEFIQASIRLEVNSRSSSNKAI